jgi:hypothetical protein
VALRLSGRQPFGAATDPCCPKRPPSSSIHLGLFHFVFFFPD